jgi:cysteine desulfurase/selenocysteine lyase
MLGPTGIGALYGRKHLLDALPPVLTGGSMITTVTMEETRFLPAPQRFEAGTQPVAQIVGLGAAVEYLTEIGMDTVAVHEAAVGEALLSGVREIPGVRVLGPLDPTRRIGTVSFDVEGVHAHDVGQFLDSRGVAARVGHHCAQPLHRRYGITASTRASSAIYTDTADVEQFLAALSEVRAFFGVHA